MNSDPFTEDEKSNNNFILNNKIIAKKQGTISEIPNTKIKIPKERQKSMHFDKEQDMLRNLNESNSSNSSPRRNVVYQRFSDYNQLNNQNN